MTKIEWTEKTWNPITGCTKISQGCKNCYAESIAKRFWKDRKFTEIKFHEERLNQPLKWENPSMVFVNSMSDLFHESISYYIIDKIFYQMEIANQHTYQVLTKRPERMLEFAKAYCKKYEVPNLPKNVWVGVSVENQDTADERIPILNKINAGTKFLSCEPLLEETILNRLSFFDFNNSLIDWVIIGAESGAKKRECKIDWIESIVNQCKEENIKVFIKQLNIGGKIEKDINKFPEHLRIREYPTK